MGKRLTRDQAREQTRLRLVDAATLSIARKGLAATSVEDIVAQAGYTRGAFYSNFSNKSDLFFELLRRVRRNALELWPRSAYEKDFARQQFLWRTRTVISVPVPSGSNVVST